MHLADQCIRLRAVGSRYIHHIGVTSLQLGKARAPLWDDLNNYTLQ